jgi:HEAT repeat protein
MFFVNLLKLGSFSLAIVFSSACRDASMNALGASPTPPPVSMSNSRGDRAMNELIQKVISKDPTATLDAKRIGRSAAEPLVRLTANEDPVVRELALRCLIESGGDGLSRIFAKFLTDESGSVRGAALAGVNKYIDPSVLSQLMSAFDNSEDLPEMREQIALLIGRTESADTRELLKRLENEKDQLARDGIVAALAKLGDQQGRADFVDGLRNAKGERLKRYLDYVDYINEEWAARALGPVLHDKTPLLRIGIDGAPDLGPGNLRACDIAVNLIAKILKPPLKFQVDMKTAYTDAQLQEVRNFLGVR